MTVRRGDAFRRGLLVGLASPYTIVQPLPRRCHHSGPADLVAAAWLDVGQALRSAMGIEEQRHGEILQERPETA